MVEVTQADRDAADPQINGLVVKITTAAIMCLDADEESTARLAAFERGIVSDIAKFRQSETAAMQARIAELEAAASLALANWGKYNSEKSDEVVYQAEKMADVLRSIAALGSAKP